MQQYNFNDEMGLNQYLTMQVANILGEAIAERGQAYAVVSGGKTPIKFFQLLAQQDLPWEKITICLADERCVSKEDDACNEKMLNNNLLQHKAKNARFVSLYDEQLNPSDNLIKAEQRIASLPAFDLVILGMGEDGHTASLFPCSDELPTGLSDLAPAIVRVNPKTAPYQRISLSKNRLLNSRHIFLHLVGHKKQVVFQQALAVNDPTQMPICAFLNPPTNLQVMYAP